MSDTVRPLHTPSAAEAHRRSEALKERIYVTFTALAVTIAFEREAEHATASEAALTLLLTVFGTVLTVFAADIVAHMVRESALPSRTEIGHLAYASFGSLVVLVLPMVILALSGFEVLELKPALRGISVTLVATLIVVALVAVHRLPVKLALKVFVLSVVAALGLAVLAVELAVH